MADKHLTEWYEPHQKPVHAGVYQRKIGGFAWFAFWSGRHWGFANSTIKLAYRDRCTESSNQYSPWRGLASDPNAGYITVRIPRPARVFKSAGCETAALVYQNESLTDTCLDAIREAMK